MGLTANDVKELANACGFELAGIAPAVPLSDFERFDRWREAGMAGEMRYLTDRRGDLRSDPRSLLESARSVICVGKLYNTDRPYSTDLETEGDGWISRYAWGADYHDVLRTRLERLVNVMALRAEQPFDWKICVDTAPLLERSYARMAGLGWIGKNTCLINQDRGSWFLLGELLVSLEFEADSPPPDRCGTCRRCIDACPTAAIVPDEAEGFKLDARLCISYLTIEKRGEIEVDLAAQMGNHIFGCDICQDVCPWNRNAPSTNEPGFESLHYRPALSKLANLGELEFRQTFRTSPVWRSKYSGFLRNVAIAAGNAGGPEARDQLQRLARHPDELVARTAQRALLRFNERLESETGRKDSLCFGHDE